VRYGANALHCAYELLDWGRSARVSSTGHTMQQNLPAGNRADIGLSMRRNT
jgi:hypothetical protein